jgi:hypothetical protein
VVRPRRLAWGLAASLAGCLGIAFLIRPITERLDPPVPWLGPLLAVFVALLALVSVVQAVAIVLLVRHRRRLARSGSLDEP